MEQICGNCYYFKVDKSVAEGDDAVSRTTQITKD